MSSDTGQSAMKNTTASAWGTDIDIEEVRSKLKDTRIVRLALDSLEEHLPAELESDDVTLGFVTLREKLAEAERRELRKIGHREYMILAPIDTFESLGGKAAAAIRTLDELGLVIRLDGQRSLMTGVMGRAGVPWGMPGYEGIRMAAG